MPELPDFNAVETLFSRLFAAVERVVPESELSDVRSFVDYGEYGIALEGVVDILARNGTAVTQEMRSLLERLAAMMSMDSASCLGALTSNPPRADEQ